MSYPYIQARNHGGTQTTVKRLVIHGTVTPCAPSWARRVANDFHTTTRDASAHYVIDPGEIVQCLTERTIGYHAPPNTGSLGFELCDPQKGSSARWRDADHEAMLRRAAAVVRARAKHWEIPLVKLTAADLRAGRKGICGHADVSAAFRQTDHTDPGTGFPWAHFMNLAKGEDDDMPDYVSVGVDGTQPLAPNTWTHVNWDHEFDDPNRQHADEGGWSVLNGPARYALTVGLTIRGLPPGTEGQVRAVEAARDDAGDIQAGPVAEFMASSGDTYVLYGLPADVVNDGRRLRVQVKQLGDAAAEIVDGSAKVLYWR